MSTRITVHFYVDDNCGRDADEVVDNYIASADEELLRDIEVWEMVKEEFNVEYE
jgi:hypothetical protein